MAQINGAWCVYFHTYKAHTSQVRIISISIPLLVSGIKVSWVFFPSVEPKEYPIIWIQYNSWNDHPLPTGLQQCLSRWGSHGQLLCSLHVLLPLDVYFLLSSSAHRDLCTWIPSCLLLASRGRPLLLDLPSWNMYRAPQIPFWKVLQCLIQVLLCFTILLLMEIIF